MQSRKYMCSPLHFPVSHHKPNQAVKITEVKKQIKYQTGFSYLEHLQEHHEWSARQGKVSQGQWQGRHRAGSAAAQGTVHSTEGSRGGPGAAASLQERGRSKVKPGHQLSKTKLGLGRCKVEHRQGPELKLSSWAPPEACPSSVSHSSAPAAWSQVTAAPYQSPG